MDVDIRRLLPSIRVPTLVLDHPAGGGALRGRPDPAARRVEIDGDYMLVPRPELADEVERFVHEACGEAEPDTVLATVLFTAGDGFFAAFDGPVRAIRCAGAIVSTVRDLGLEVRAGLHTGECEQAGEKLGGLAVSIGARVAAHAGPGELLVSRTVRDLVAGSDIAFHPRGPAALKGVPGEWELYAVRGR